MVVEQPEKKDSETEKKDLQTLKEIILNQDNDYGIEDIEREMNTMKEDLNKLEKLLKKELKNWDNKKSKEMLDSFQTKIKNKKEFWTTNNDMIDNETHKDIKDFQKDQEGQNFANNINGIEYNKKTNQYEYGNHTIDREKVDNEDYLKKWKEDLKEREEDRKHINLGEEVDGVNNGIEYNYKTNQYEYGNHTIDREKINDEEDLKKWKEKIDLEKNEKDGKTASAIYSKEINKQERGEEEEKKGKEDERIKIGRSPENKQNSKKINKQERGEEEEEKKGKEDERIKIGRSPENKQNSKEINKQERGEEEEKKGKGDERIKTSRSPENRQNSKEVQEEEKYEVKKGDTLWAIAEEFLGSGYDWEKIQKANELEGTTIYPGQNLIIPKEEKEDGKNDSKKEDKEGYNKSVKSKLSKEENKKTKFENNEESKDDNKEKEVNESKEKTEIDFENLVSEMENIVYEGKNENGEIKLNRQGSFLEGFKTNDLLISTENGNYSLYDEKGKFQVVDISNSEKAKSEISNLDNFMRKVEEGERKINRLEGDLKEKDQYSNKLALEKKQQIKESLENYLDSLKDGNKYDISKFDQQKMQNKMNGVDYLQEKYSSEKANETLEKAKEINKDDENFKKTIDQIGINKSEIKKVEKINIGGVLNNLPFVGNDSYLVEKSKNNLGITEIKGTYYTVEASSKEDIVSKLNIIKELGEKESINNYSNSLNKIDIKQYPKSTKEE